MLNFKPESVWKWFDELLSIPRCSKNEERIRFYLQEIAERMSIRYATDTIGNIVYYISASPGMESKKKLILQAHMDMVCNKLEGVAHDFSQDPIKVKVEGDYLITQGTTLGADNGIGMAIMLALLEDASLSHGPLEFLFTVDEESGLTGAFKLDASLLKGKLLINLDNEDLGSICIGSAGGVDIICRVPLNDRVPIEDMIVYKIALKGLKGGHSGVDIHLPRLNAITSSIDILEDTKKRAPELLLISIDGGTQKNAIPREVSMKIALYPQSQIHIRESIIKNTEKARSSEPDFSLSLEKIDYTGHIEGIDPVPLIETIKSIPNGVIKMSEEVNNFVETSNNIGLIRVTDDAIIITSHARSCKTEELPTIYQQITSRVKDRDVQVDIGGHYPGWEPDPTSSLLHLCKTIWERMKGESPSIKALHAGLECGILKNKIKGLDAVSIGPQIDHPHSPDERVNIGSVYEIYEYLRQIVQSLPDEEAKHVGT
ncbi:MAG: beta-Ala-His dipeptidase [bacterium]